MIRGIWEEELAVGKENMGDSPAARLPVDSEMEAEAYENFFRNFDRNQHLGFRLPVRYFLRLPENDDSDSNAACPEK